MTEEELIIVASEETVTETTEPIQVIVVESRPFLTTSFADYTVTEGLLLTLLLVVIVSKVLKFAKGCFAWLLS